MIPTASFMVLTPVDLCFFHSEEKDDLDTPVSEPVAASLLLRNVDSLPFRPGINKGIAINADDDGMDVGLKEIKAYFRTNG